MVKFKTKDGKTISFTARKGKKKRSRTASAYAKRVGKFIRQGYSFKEAAKKAKKGAR